MPQKLGLGHCWLIVADPEHGGCWHTRVLVRVTSRHTALGSHAVKGPHGPQTSKKIINNNNLSICKLFGKIISTISFMVETDCSVVVRRC